MEQIFTIAALWLGLAVISAVIAYHLRISIALIEICVGVLTAAVAGLPRQNWMVGFQSGMAAVSGHLRSHPAHLLAGAELNGVCEASLRK